MPATKRKKVTKRAVAPTKRKKVTKRAVAPTKRKKVTKRAVAPTKRKKVAKRKAPPLPTKLPPKEEAPPPSSKPIPRTASARQILKEMEKLKPIEWLPEEFAPIRMIGDALRDFVMSRGGTMEHGWQSEERRITGSVFHQLKQSFRQAYGEKRWRKWFRWVVDEYMLEDYIFDYEALRDT